MCEHKWASENEDTPRHAQWTCYNCNKDQLSIRRCYVCLRPSIYETSSAYNAESDPVLRDFREFLCFDHFTKRVVPRLPKVEVSIECEACGEIFNSAAQHLCSAAVCQLCDRSIVPGSVFCQFHHYFVPRTKKESRLDELAETSASQQSVPTTPPKSELRLSKDKTKRKHRKNKQRRCTNCDKHIGYKTYAGLCRDCSVCANCENGIPSVDGEICSECGRREEQFRRKKRPTCKKCAQELEFYTKNDICSACSAREPPTCPECGNVIILWIDGKPAPVCSHCMPFQEQN